MVIKGFYAILYYQLLQNAAPYFGFYITTDRITNSPLCISEPGEINITNLHFATGAEQIKINIEAGYENVKI